MAEPAVRPAGGGRRSLSVVLGPRRYDVVVDEQLLVAEVLALVEPSRELQAVTMTGQPVPLDTSVALARLPTGTMLLAAPLEAHVPAPAVRTGRPGRASGDGRTAGSRAASGPVTPAGSSSRRLMEGPSTRPGAAPRQNAVASVLAGHVRAAAVVVVAGLLSSTALVALSRVRDPSLVWPAVLALLLVAAGFALAQLPAPERLLPFAAPLLGVLGGAIGARALTSSALVAVVGACVGAALVALSGRPRPGPDRYVPRVWVVLAAGLALLNLVVLILGTSMAVLAAVVLAAVVLVARVVPDLVIDVDDDVLLDIGRLSVTSWSPREARRPRRRGWRIDDRAVGSVVRAAGTEQVAALVGLAVLSAASSGTLLAGLRPVALFGPSPVQSPLAVRLLLGTAAVALALTARAYRRARDRRLLRLAALSPALALAVDAAVGAAGPAGWAVALVAVALAFGVLALSQALAAGYRSLWASRLGDIAEVLALCAVVPLALWAGGFVAWAMGLAA